MTLPDGSPELIAAWHRQALACLREGADFARESRGGFLVLRQRRPEAEEALARLLPDPDLAFSGATLLKPGSRTHLGVVRLAGEDYVLKRYNCRGAGYRVANALRRSRAVRTWLTAWEFLVRGVPVPRPLICLEERCARLLGRSYVLMERVEGAGTLRQAWAVADPRRRWSLLSFFGELLGRMHRTGMIHGDLKWDNLMVGTGSGPVRACLVDLDGSRALKHPSRQAARKDLERFLRDLAREGGDAAARGELVQSWERSFHGREEAS